MPGKVIPVFTHIPKTAGTTMHRIIQWQYLFKPGSCYTAEYIPGMEHFKSLPVKDKDRIKVMLGYFPFGIHDHCPYKVRYFTMLRQPQKRTISFYNYILWVYVKEDLKKYSLKQMLESGMFKEFDNCQVRHLCGVADIPYGAVNENHLQLAIHNLRTHYITGITEHFDESVLLFAKEFNWTAPYYIHSNVSKVKTSDIKIDAATQALLDQHNKYDHVLYVAALEIFKEQLARAGAGFKDDVIAFAAQNKKHTFRTTVAVHVTSKNRYLNKHHWWTLRYYLPEYLKAIRDRLFKPGK